MVPARTLDRDADGWPRKLSTIPRPPARLRVRGELGPAGERRVAVVGARVPDDYGRELARAFGQELARAGVCVVSGGAEGVDAAAHLGALEAGGRTIAVLGTGIDVVYPAGHRALFERIAAQGALVSEYEDGTPGARWTFPERNRLIAALAEAVVVVRAGAHSGALLTAGWAKAQGVPVFAVPGDVREALTQGPLALLRAGARVAASAADVLDALGMQPALPLGAPSAEGLDAAGQALLAALGRAPRHADEVAREAGLGAPEAMAGLLTLELRGLCEQRPGHLFLRRG